MSSYNFFSNQNTLHYGELATVIVEGWSEVKPWAQTNNSDRLNMTLVLPLTSRAVWLKSRARYPINYRHVNYYSFSSPACFIHVRVWNIISLMNHSLPGPRALPRAISASWSFEKSMACIFIVYVWLKAGINVNSASLSGCCFYMNFENLSLIWRRHQLQVK